MHRQQRYQTLAGPEDSALDDADLASNRSLHADSAAGGSTFLRQSTLASPVSNAHSSPRSQDPPLMPLFTPVLQDFQSRFGSSILHQHADDHHHRHYADDDDDNDDDSNPPDFHEQQHEEYDDNDHDHDHDMDSSSRRSLLFAGVGGSPGSTRSLDTVSNKQQQPFFAGTRLRAASPLPSKGRGGASRLRPNLDLGTDHEAPASLMIEMNHDQQDDDDDAGYWNFGDRARRRLGYKRPGMNAAELAMWKWVNVENLDNFLARVYDYYVGKGMYTILLERSLNLLLSTGTFVMLLLFAVFWVGQLTRLIYDVPKMVDMCNFYTYLLQIPDEDIQSVAWHEVVTRIIKIRDNNPNTSTAATIHTTDMQRLNAHDIANRIMRKENFMIAMFNKELLDLRPPVPLLRSRTILTRILEWSLGFCILGYVFDDRGQVRKRFLKDTRRAELVDGLKRRFQFMGLATLIFSPFISIYLMLYFFFRYFEEYHKNPSSIGTRQYTPLAKWKFKEFNELPHLFDARINTSYPLAMKYINQFPKEKTILVARFVAFISGSFAAVLALMTLFDQELLLGLEITPEKTVFFYLGLFGTIMAVSRGMIPDQTESFDPELLLQGVVEHTHYMPTEWRDKLHTDDVRKQFALLFEYNAVLFLMEFMSLLLTPLILCLSLPNCSEKIVDFFREFTVHVDGVGYVCSFAVFDFKRHGNVKYGAPVDAAADQRLMSNEGKMEKSFLNFKHNNPDWEPNDPEGSMYLSKLLETETGPMYGRHRPQHHAGDHLPPSMPWGQSSAYLRPRGGASAGAFYNPDHRNRYHGKSRLGGGMNTRRDNATDDDDDNEDDHDVEVGGTRRGSDGQGPGIKFFLSSKPRTQQGQRQRHGDSGSESSEYDEPNRPIGLRGTQPLSGLGFTTSLGDSFVSEIGQSSSTGRRGSSSRGGRGASGRGEKGKGSQRDGEDLSDVEDEREVQKKGVVGLLNQIYEMSHVTM
ncbi:autophagy protein atg9 [Dissophora globulifera]|uniref:Autophagy-related protein 9 n=1 Tax=Dissophora globulifera TaxID=979702 RepID=A0A9P6R418_9FUNG|nr:autophagy protein atg9 [Dissophora globulifera]